MFLSRGVGWKSQKKLEPRGLCSVTDVWDLGDEAETVLGEIIGLGNAQKIVKYCHGKDDRPVAPDVRKSIGAEVSVFLYTFQTIVRVTNYNTSFSLFFAVQLWRQVRWALRG